MFLEIVSSCIRYNVYQNDAGSGYDDDIGDFLNKQKVLLFFNITLFFIQLGSFYFLKEYSDIQVALLTASIFGAIHYFMLNIYMKQELIKIL